MPRPTVLSRCAAVLFLCVLLAPSPSRAEATDWPDADGTRFQGEPAAVFGSLALFRTADPVLKRVPLRALPPEDCRRFHHALAHRPARANRWAEARSRATRPLFDGLQRLDFQYRKLVPADLSALPEPELLIVLYGYQGYSGSWFMVFNFIPTFHRIQNVYPGLTATVFFGTAPSVSEHHNMAEASWMPWLVTKFDRQEAMPALRPHAAQGGTWLTAMTRDGDLLLSAQPTDLPAIRRFIDDLTELLWASNPLNARAWADRAHYGRAVRPVEFATASTGPELVGHPLRADGLRQRGVGRVEARLEIDAEGKVTTATLRPGPAVPDKLAGPLTDTLRRAVFLPAMQAGQAVASTYGYVLEVPPANPQWETDATWLDRSMRGEVPLNDWLLLTSIPVDQKEFDEIESVGADGKVILRSFEVSDNRVSRASQLSAFHADFFGEAGAASVRPAAGQTQIVDGRTLTWRAARSADGYVNLETGHQDGPAEYCVGYAWTEIEVSADVQAWLGIGSDDGLKIWHNGELVKDRWVRRISRMDDDIVPLRLKAGKNHLLFKIQNITRDWSFVARLRFRDR